MLTIDVCNLNVGVQMLPWHGLLKLGSQANEKIVAAILGDELYADR